MGFRVIYRIAASGVFLFVIGGVAYAEGVVQIGDPTVDSESGRVIVPIRLEGVTGLGVSSLDFRVRYDASMLEPVAAEEGSAVTDSNKRVLTNVREPGMYVVVVSGLNQNTISSGHLVTITFNSLDESGRGVNRVQVTDTTFAALNGTEVPSEGSEIVFAFDGEMVEEVETLPDGDEGDSVPEEIAESDETESSSDRELAGSAAPRSTRPPGSAFSGLSPTRSATGGDEGAAIRSDVEGRQLAALRRRAQDARDSVSLGTGRAGSDEEEQGNDPGESDSDDETGRLLETPAHGEGAGEELGTLAKVSPQAGMGALRGTTPVGEEDTESGEGLIRVSLTVLILSTGAAILLTVLAVRRRIFS